MNVADRNIEAIYHKTPPGLPPHILRIKEGAIMMIIRNILVPVGLCNGTRVQVMDVSKDNTILCRFIAGRRKGQLFHLARFRFRFGGDKETNKHGAVVWERIQFPLRPGFVMTTNKSQGR